MQRYLQMNEYDGTIYFNKEQFEHLLFWLAINHINQLARSDKKEISAAKIHTIFRKVNTYIKLADKCGYKGEDFLDKVENV